MSQLPSNHRSPIVPGRAAGVTLVELLIAMTIGLVLIIGATRVYVDSHTAYAVNETTARLQERSEEHTSELQSPCNLVCRLLLEKKNKDHKRVILPSKPVVH